MANSRDISARSRRQPVLASDAERERAMVKLRDHHAAGRIDLAELERRIDAAYRARDRGELRALFADLPRAANRPPAWAVHRAAVRFHTTAYLAGNGTVIAAWAATGGGDFWPGYMLGPTSALLAAHAFGVPWAARALKRRSRERRKR